MKKIATVGELRAYCESKKPREIVFHTDNQREYDLMKYPCSMVLHFPSMLVYENPNTIYLKAGRNVLTLNQVKYVEIVSSKVIVGTTIIVQCHKMGVNEEEENTYTLLIF